jgi:hydrogenase maturation factor
VYDANQKRKMATIAGKGVKKKIKMSFIQKEQT